MKIINYIILSICVLLSFGCPQITVPPEVESEDWIAITDIDGNNLEYICKSEGAIPYFVPNLEYPGEELILLDYGSGIDLVKQDGNERITILDSIGSIYSFSQDKTKMLLNYDGEIYMANVDGSELQNLTNTTDIYERDPSFFDNDNLIIYTYNDASFSEAYLVIKNLSTNQDSIVYNYYVNSTNQNIYFSNPFFQNNSQIIYNFKFEEQIEGVTEYYYEVHNLNLDNYADEIVYNDSRVYHFNYNYCVNLSLFYTDIGTLLFNNSSSEVLHIFSDSAYHDNYGFSSNANYLTVGELIYRLNDSVEYFIDMEDNDFNQNETKIVGVNSRKYE